MSDFRLIAAAIVFFVLGSLAACLVAFLFGAAGLPGGLIAVLIRRGKSAIARGAGVLIAVLCQSYVALAFAAAAIESARSITRNATGVGKWAFWASALLVACAPSAIAVKSVASYLNDPNENHSPAALIACRAAIYSRGISFIGCIMFAFFPPAISWGWGWIPHF